VCRRREPITRREYSSWKKGLIRKRGAIEKNFLSERGKRRGGWKKGTVGSSNAPERIRKKRVDKTIKKKHGLPYQIGRIGDFSGRPWERTVLDP